MRTILYITYDGLTDALGQSQILAYLKRLNNLENEIVILSFEKEEHFKKGADQIRKIIEQHKLVWIPVTYTRKPPILSTLRDITKGFRTCKQLHEKYNFQIVHCRGYIAAVLGRRLKKRYGLKFIFDMRGWWADEKLESGYWDKRIYQPVYRYIKKLERQFFIDCDYAVSLTYKGKEAIVNQNLATVNKIGVIPTCVDFEIFKSRDNLFREEMRRKLGIVADEKVFVYSGSLGGNYDPYTLIKVFQSFKQVYPKSYLLILSKDSFNENLKQQFLLQGIGRLAIYNSPFTEVTNYLLAGDVGFIYYKMSFSTIGRSPTKLGEYWASGLPVIAFKGIGDLDYIFDRYPESGVLLPENIDTWTTEMQALKFIDPSLLRQYASDYFHINKGVQFYQGIYERLIPTIKEVYESVNNSAKSSF
ncbi:MAG: glycosyltransferase [Aquaticitalea sp.]